MHKDERLAVELSFSKVGMVLPLQTLLFVASCVCCNLKIAFAGKFGAQLHIGWFEGARLLVMAYKVSFFCMLPESQSAFKSNANLSLHHKPAVYSVVFVRDDMGKGCPATKQVIRLHFLQNIYCDELKDSTGVTKNFILSNGGTRCPTWLGAVAPEAQVSERVLEIFESFKDKDHCLAQVMQSVTGMAH